MAVSYSDFIVRFPFFSSADAAQVQVELANATRAVNSAMFAEQTDDAIGLLTAHRMALHPGGENARMKSVDGTSRTTYGDQYAEMLRRVVPGDRVP